MASSGGPSQIRRTKSPKSPKHKHCFILDSDAEVDFEIQSAPPYRILPKVRKPKTPPVQRIKKSPARSPGPKHRFIPSDCQSDLIFYKRPSPPRQVTFRDQCAPMPRDVRVPSGLVDILSSMEACPAQRLRPVAFNPTNGRRHKACNNSSQTDHVPVVPREKPQVSNVEILRRTPSTTTRNSLNRTRACRSNEELNKLELIHDLHDLQLLGGLQSSFVDPDAPIDLSRRSVYIELGEYQTLLKHSAQTDHVYSLPQPQCYGEDTLRAVKRITDKYDTCQRRLIQAASFSGKEMDSVPEALTQATVTNPELPEIVFTSTGRPPETQGPSVNLTRLDLFYRSVGTDVCVCQCPADLSTGKLLPGQDEVLEWQSVHTGIPLFVLDTGQGRRPRQLKIVLANNDTAFPVWQDKICYLSNYCSESPCEHLFFLSESLSVKGRLSFREAAHGDAFLAWFKEATSDPNDELWKVSSKKTTKRNALKSKRSKLDKSAISSPCNFAHITRIEVFSETLKKQFRHSMGEEETLEPEMGEFRARLPTS